MIRASLQLMIVGKNGNHLVTGLSRWLARRRKQGRFFLTAQVIDDERMVREVGTTDLSQKIHSTLNTADAAVVILSPDDSVRMAGSRRKYLPRPNVSYELGYLLARLPWSSVEVLVDCVYDRIRDRGWRKTHRESWLPDQPSDLISAYKKHCKSLEEAKQFVTQLLTSLDATREAHDTWGRSFNFKALPTFRAHDEYLAWIDAQVKDGARSIGWQLLLEHAQFLLDDLGPRPLHQIKSQLSVPKQHSDGWLAHMTIELLLTYWRVSQVERIQRILKECRKFLRLISDPRTWQDSLHAPLLRVLYCDYAGLIEERRQNHSKALKWFQHSLSEAQSSMEEPLKSVWMGYVFFNIARVAGDARERENAYESACHARREVCEATSGTIFFHGRQYQLATALGHYIDFLRKRGDNKNLRAVIKPFRDLVEPVLHDSILPRSALHARAVYNLIKEDQGHLLHDLGWDIPGDPKMLEKIVLSFHSWYGPALGAGHMPSRSQERRRRKK